jgi:spermidine/putrescine-binding protein
MNKLKIGIRAAIVAFWISLIILFLFLPTLKNYCFSQDKSINIFAWVDMVDTDRIAGFEKKTGVKVNISYYENYQELLAKLRVSSDGEYDLVMLTEYALDYIDVPKDLKLIDKSKLTFWKDINYRFLNHSFDPDNKYTIPFYWDVYGLGVDASYLPKDTNEYGWDLIFDKEKSLKPVVMINEAVESMSAAALYLFGKANKLTEAELYQVKDLMVKQKKWVEAYTDLRADYYLISQASPAVLSQSAYINRALKTSDQFKFIIPKEGSFLVIDSLVIPKSSKKDNETYKFINFLYEEEVVRAVMEENAYMTVLKPILDSVDLSYLGKDILEEETFKKFHFFGGLGSNDLLNKLWIEIKSA